MACDIPCDEDCDASCHAGHYITPRKPHADNACHSAEEWYDHDGTYPVGDWESLDVVIADAK